MCQNFDIYDRYIQLNIKARNNLVKINIVRIDRVNALTIFQEQFKLIFEEVGELYVLLRNDTKRTPLTMSVILQFNCPTHNETARKAMESYIEILQKAFERYQNLWEDYIKLQETCGQCNIHSSSETAVNTSCTKIKNETISHLNANVQENKSIPLLELDTMNISPINFNSDTGTSLSEASECLHKNTDENNRAESPVFCRTFLKTGNNSARRFVRSPKAMYNNSSSDMKTHHSIEKVSSKYNRKLEFSTTHHVETTFLPNGKRLKQSRLAFNPVKSNDKITLSSSEDKHKAANISHSVKQNVIGDISIANAANTVIENDYTSNTSEISEDVIEISPTQRTVTSKVRRCLKLKKKIPIKYMKKISPNKYLDSNIVPEIIEDVDFGLCPSPKHISTQIKDSKSLINTAVNTLKDKVNTSYFSPIKRYNKADSQIKQSIEGRIYRKEDQLRDKVQKNKVLIQNDLACKDETFYLPAEQAANRRNIDNFNLDDTENKPPEKKMLLDEFNVLPKKRADISEQLNMRCKADRAKLNGWDCWECKEYYKNLLLSKEELQKRKNQCSRHRYKYERPNTPEGFWDPEFPETLSCTYQQNKN